jgi:Nucleotidyl transferase AbiEii toxin, Type IV TA system
MTTDAYRQVIAATASERLDLFLSAANRLGTPVGNVEKDFWVSWTLNSLYHRLPAGGPRLLFKGGTSLSKAHGLIRRFSEDIDITVFRDDLDQAVSIEDLQALSNKKRQARLDGIRDACRSYITGPLHNALTVLLATDTGGAGRIELIPTIPMARRFLSGTQRRSRVTLHLSALPSASNREPNQLWIPIALRSSDHISRTRYQT